MRKLVFGLACCCAGGVVALTGCGDSGLANTPTGPSVAEMGNAGGWEGRRSVSGGSAYGVRPDGEDAIGGVTDGLTDGQLKVLDSAEPVSPKDDAIEGLTPVLVASNARGRFREGEKFEYEFELYERMDGGRAGEPIRASVPQGDTDTRYEVSEALGRGKWYQWRVRAFFDDAQDDFEPAYDGWSGFAIFRTRTPVSLEAPTPEYPVGGETVRHLRPVFEVVNGSVRVSGGDEVVVRNEIAVWLDESPGKRIRAEAAAGDGTTRIELEEDLEPVSSYSWQARATAEVREEGGGAYSVEGDWSAVENFVTPDPSAGPTNGPPRGDCCPPPNRLDVVLDVAAATGDLIKDDPPTFTQRLAECLAVTDGDWGRRINNNGNLGKDTVGYRVDASTHYSVDVILGAGTGNGKPQWATKGKRTRRWIRVDGSNCILGNIQ